MAIGRKWAFRRSGGWATALLIAALSACATVGRADPAWWTGDPKEALDAAGKAQKPLILYFETEKSDDCIRMREECFPKLPAAAATRFIWIRLQPDAVGKDFFDFYAIYQTPQLVVLNAKADEKGRIQGFIAPDLLAASLDELFPAAPAQPAAPGAPAPPPAADKTLFIAGDGIARTLKEYEEIANIRKANESAGHFLYESFDKFGTVDDMAPLGFNPLIRHTMRIDPGIGRYNSPGLYVGSDLKANVRININPSVLMRLDLSPKLAAHPMGRGKLKVSFQARALKLPETGRLVELARVIIADAAANPPAMGVTQQPPAPKSYPLSLTANITQWTERSATTGDFDFKREKAYVLFWVNSIGDAYVADDFTVDILPVEGAENVKAMTARVIPDPVRLCSPPAVLGNDRLFAAFDLDKDGIILKSDIPGEMVAFFNAMDKNHDGKLQIGVPEK